MCSTRRPGRNSGTMHQGGSRAPWGIRPDASTSRPSKARLSSPRRQAGRGTCRRTRVLALLRPPALTALLPSRQRCCRATSHPRKSQQRSLRPHRRRLLAANASATLLEELKVLAWYFLSPDTFRSEVTDTRMGSGSASRIKRPNALRERIDYLFAYAFARRESEQNSSLPIGRD